MLNSCADTPIGETLNSENGVCAEAKDSDTMCHGHVWNSVQIHPTGKTPELSNDVQMPKGHDDDGLLLMNN